MRVRNLRCRIGFTLLELLLVCAILMILLALMLPAIQKVRSAMSRAACMNRLRELGLAAHNYHNNKNQLPPAVVFPYAQAEQQFPNGDARAPFGPNWAVYLLPYIEYESLYKQADIRTYPGSYQEPPQPTGQPVPDGFAFMQTWSSYDVSWRAIRGISVDAYICPADRGHDTPFTSPDLDGSRLSPVEENWARGNYAANAGPEKCEDSSGGLSLRRSGPVMSANFGAKLDQLTAQDGTSSTIMFNEVRVGVSSGDRRGTWAMGFAGSSITCGNGLAANPTPNNLFDHPDGDEIQGCYSFWYEGIGTDDGMGCLKYEGWYAQMFDDYSRRGQARSQHPHGVNACFADGSVHFISNSVQPSIWRSMLSTDDGEPYDYDF